MGGVSYNSQSLTQNIINEKSSLTHMDHQHIISQFILSIYAMHKLLCFTNIWTEILQLKLGCKYCTILLVDKLLCQTMCTKKASKIFCTKSAHTMLVKLPPDWVRSLKHEFPYSQRSVSNDVTLLRTDIFCDNNIKLSVRCFLNICCSRHTHYMLPQRV